MLSGFLCYNVIAVKMMVLNSKDGTLVDSLHFFLGGLCAHLVAYVSVKLLC